MSLPILVFDVLGTVVDERGSFRAAMTEELASRSDALASADRWLAAVDEEVAGIAGGDLPWRRWDDVVRAALSQAAPQLNPPGFERAASVGHRLTPWPDSAAGLAALKVRYDVVALSNAGLLPLLDSSRSAGLVWSAVLSSEMVRSAKPDPVVYRFLLDQLDTAADGVLMVAAHPWDLRAAAALGMRTAYIRRPGEGSPADDDRFDLSVPDVPGLAAAISG